LAQISRHTRDFLLGPCKLRNPAKASSWIVQGLAKLFLSENAIICRHDGTPRIQTHINPSHDKINVRSVIYFVKAAKSNRRSAVDPPRCSKSDRSLKTLIPSASEPRSSIPPSPRTRIANPSPLYKINTRSVIKFVKHNSAPPEHTPEKVNRYCRRYTLRHRAGKGCRPTGER
jgi:hypothetical protein